MSSRCFLDSVRIYRGPGFFGRFQKITVSDRAGHDQIDGTLQQALQTLQKAEIRIRMLALVQGQEFDQKIDVTALKVEVIPGSGTENLQGFDPVALA